MIPRFTLKPGQVVVDSLIPAFRWFADGLNTVSDPPPRDVVPLLIERRIDTSGAFYGIGASEVGDSFIERGAAEFIGTHSDSDPTPRGLRFVSKWGIEINRGCQAEACNARGGPEHLFNDICDFLPHIWRKKVRTRWACRLQVATCGPEEASALHQGQAEGSMHQVLQGLRDSEDTSAPGRVSVHPP